MTRKDVLCGLLVCAAVVALDQASKGGAEAAFEDVWVRTNAFAGENDEKIAHLHKSSDGPGDAFLDRDLAEAGREQPRSGIARR